MSRAPRVRGGYRTRLEAAWRASRHASVRIVDRLGVALARGGRDLRGGDLGGVREHDPHFGRSLVAGDQAHDEQGEGADGANASQVHVWFSLL